MSTFDIHNRALVYDILRNNYVLLRSKICSHPPLHASNIIIYIDRMDFDLLFKGVFTILHVGFESRTCTKCVPPQDPRSIDKVSTRELIMLIISHLFKFLPTQFWGKKRPTWNSVSHSLVLPFVLRISATTKFSVAIPLVLTDMKASIANRMLTNVHRRHTPALGGTRRGHSVSTSILHKNSNVVVSLATMPFSLMLAMSRTTCQTIGVLSGASQEMYASILFAMRTQAARYLLAIRHFALATTIWSAMA